MTTIESPSTIQIHIHSAEHERHSLKGISRIYFNPRKDNEA